MARLSPARLEQAAEWHIALHEGEIVASERERFLDWLSNEDNAHAFAAASRAWDASGEAAQHPDIQDWIDNARNPASDALARLPLGQSRIWAIAASLFAALMITSFWLIGFNDPSQEYATRIAERRTVTLEDGTVVSLDAHSVIGVKLSEDARKVTLSQGRAQFDVTKDTARPFTVYSADQAITATGTTFTVEALAEETRVVLLEGEVAVARVATSRVEAPERRAKVTLRPGELFVASNNSEKGPTVVQTNLADVSNWQEGYLTFENEPLANVVDRFNRYSQDKLEIADEAAGGVRVSGRYKADDVSALLEGLLVIHSINAVRDGETISLSRASAGD